MSSFQVATKDKVTLVKCPALLNQSAATEFFALSQNWMDHPTEIFILDFSEVQRLETAIFRPLILFFQTLKSKSCFLFTINVRPEIASVIQSNGLDGVLSPRASLKQAFDSAGIKITRPKIDVNFINPFIKATQATLELQANTKVKIGKPYLKKDGHDETIDIAGVLSLTSPVFNGSIALCFPAKVFLAIYSNLLGEKHEVITKDIEDAAGELLNIIFGQSKAELNEKVGYQIQKAIPTVIRGTNLVVHHLARGIAVILPFETDAGPFHLEISTESP